jgi:hypothetical protein
MCEAANPQGVTPFRRRVVRDCGCHMQSPCLGECGMTPACAPMGPPPDGACASCIDAKNVADPCYVQAATEPQCQQNPDCAALAACILGCP